MQTTVQGHYESVRYLPSLKSAEPFQILGFTEDWQGSVDNFLVVFMNRKQAKDLHKSLGVMLNMDEDEDNV